MSDSVAVPGAVGLSVTFTVNCEDVHGTPLVPVALEWNVALVPLAREAVRGVPRPATGVPPAAPVVRTGVSARCPRRRGPPREGQRGDAAVRVRRVRVRMRLPLPGVGFSEAGVAGRGGATGRDAMGYGPCPVGRLARAGPSGYRQAVPGECGPCPGAAMPRWGAGPGPVRRTGPGAENAQTVHAGTDPARIRGIRGSCRPDVQSTSSGRTRVGE